MNYNLLHEANYTIDSLDPTPLMKRKLLKSNQSLEEMQLLKTFTKLSKVRSNKRRLIELQSIARGGLLEQSYATVFWSP